MFSTTKKLAFVSDSFGTWVTTKLSTPFSINSEMYLCPSLLGPTNAKNKVLVLQKELNKLEAENKNLKDNLC